MNIFLLIFLMPLFILGFAAVIAYLSRRFWKKTIGYDDNGKAIQIPFEEYRQHYICPVAYRYGARE